MSRVKSTVYGKVEAGASTESLREKSGVWSPQKPPNPRWWHPLALIAAFLFGILIESQLLLPFQRELASNSELTIIARVSAGNAIEVYVNNVYDRSYRMKIDPGVMSRYVFSNLPEKITSLRIDPTDVSGATVEIQGIEYSTAKKNIFNISPIEIGNWAKNQMEGSADNNQRIFQTQGNDPWLIGNGLSLQDPTHEAAGWPSWVRANASVILALCLALVLFVGASGYRFGIPLALSLLSIHYLVPFIARELSQRSFSYPNIRHSIGSAAYAGYIKTPENIEFAITFAASLLIGALLGVICSRGITIASERRRAFGLGAYVLVFVIFFVFNFPPFSGMEDRLFTSPLEVSGFDWANVFTWDYLAQYGFLPFRDFWFPYGGDYLQLGNFPQAQWSIFLVRCTLFAMLLYGLLELENQKWLKCLLSLTVLGLFVEASVFQGSKRYLVSIALLFVAGGIVRRQSKAIFPFVCFGVLLGWCFSREPNQLFYAAPGLLALAIFHARQMIAKGWRRIFLIQSLAAMGTGCVLIGIQLLLLFTRGQWDGFFNFYSRMSAMAVSVSVPAPIEAWYQFTPRFENVLILGIHLLASGGAFVFFGRGSRERKVCGLTILGISVLLAMIFFKLLLRPHMAQQMLAGVFLGSVLLVSVWSEFWTRSQRIIVALLSGLLCAQCFSGNFVGDVFSQHLNLAQAFPANLAAVSHGISTSREELDAYYRQDRFTKLDADQKSVLSYLNGLGFARFSQELFVLGDDSYFYVMLKEKPCPYLSYYDGSNAGAQLEQLQCIRDAQSKTIVWDATIKNFDGVPNILRTPLLFEYVMANYLPEKRFGRFQVFRRRNAGEPFPWEFWTDILGSDIELGALPWMSSFSSLKDCSSAAACLEFVAVSGSEQPPALSISVGQKKYTLSWKSAAAASHGHILLDRLWFWSAARREGLEPKLPDGRAIVKKSSETEFLY